MGGMVGDDGTNASTTASVEELLRKFLEVQHRRASVYNVLHEGFADLLKTGSEAPYQEICSQVTSSFSECSMRVLEIEAALRNPSNGRLDLADVLQDLQAQEKQKLHMTVTLQVLRRAGRPSERERPLAQGHQNSVSSHSHGPLCSHGPEREADGEDSGLELAQLEAEYDAAIKEATGLVRDAILEINDHIDVVRYEIQDLEQKKLSAEDGVMQDAFSSTVNPVNA